MSFFVNYEINRVSSFLAGVLGVLATVLTVSPVAFATDSEGSSRRATSAVQIGSHAGQLKNRASLETPFHLARVYLGGVGVNAGFDRLLEHQISVGGAAQVSSHLYNWYQVKARALYWPMSNTFSGAYVGPLLSYGAWGEGVSTLSFGVDSGYSHLFANQLTAGGGMEFLFNRMNFDKDFWGNRQDVSRGLFSMALKGTVGYAF